jgi:uncharacterized protein YjlB
MTNRIRLIHFERATDVPNSFLPVVLYRSVLPAHAAGKARAFRQRFQWNGWSGVWTDTVYDYTHFHSNAHEVLGIAKGKVTLRLGGNSGSLVRLKAGDMLVLPAGVGHRRVSESQVEVVGAYPRGQSHYDMKRKGRRIPRVALPSTDPFYGPDGSLLKAWTVKAARAPRSPRFLSVRNLQNIVCLHGRRGNAVEVRDSSFPGLVPLPVEIAGGTGRRTRCL